MKSAHELRQSAARVRAVVDGAVFQLASAEDTMERGHAMLRDAQLRILAAKLKGRFPPAVPPIV